MTSPTVVTMSEQKCLRCFYEKYVGSYSPRVAIEKMFCICACGVVCSGPMNHRKLFPERKAGPLCKMYENTAENRLKYCARWLLSRHHGFSALYTDKDIFGGDAQYGPCVCVGKAVSSSLSSTSGVDVASSSSSVSSSLLSTSASLDKDDDADDDDTADVDMDTSSEGVNIADEDNARGVKRARVPSSSSSSLSSASSSSSTSSSSERLATKGGRSTKRGRSTKSAASSSSSVVVAKTKKAAAKSSTKQSSTKAQPVVVVAKDDDREEGEVRDDDEEEEEAAESTQDKDEDDKDDDEDDDQEPATVEEPASKRRSRGLFAEPEVPGKLTFLDSNGNWSSRLLRPDTDKHTLTRDSIEKEESIVAPSILAVFHDFEDAKMYTFGRSPHASVNCEKDGQFERDVEFAIVAHVPRRNMYSFLNCVNDPVNPTAAPLAQRVIAVNDVPAPVALTGLPPGSTIVFNETTMHWDIVKE